MPLKSTRLGALAAAAILIPKFASAAPITTATLYGMWELQTACMNDHGKPGACIEMKQGSLELRFANGGWNSSANDLNKTKKSGSFEIHKGRLILRNTDGSVYQDWQPDLRDDRQNFRVTDRSLIETFVRAVQKK